MEDGKKNNTFVKRRAGRVYEFSKEIYYWRRRKKEAEYIRLLREAPSKAEYYRRFIGRITKPRAATLRHEFGLTGKSAIKCP